MPSFDLVQSSEAHQSLVVHGNKATQQIDYRQGEPLVLKHAARNAVAAIVSYLVARLFGLPEAYWAPISTLIVIQSTLGAALPISVQSLAGTAIGAAAGAATATYFRGSLWAFGITVFLIGILCAVVRVERSVYRYAGTLQWRL
jgi:uncharacterized membrane protein YgaE (UPF0421/DUF939 family)